MDISLKECNILSLPVEVLRKFCGYLCPKACVSLMLSCRTMMFHLNRDTLLWKSIFSQLGIRCPEGYWEEAKDSDLFPQPFRRFMSVRDGLKKHDTSKSKPTLSRLKYNIEFRKQLQFLR